MERERKNRGGTLIPFPQKTGPRREPLAEGAEPGPCAQMSILPGRILAKEDAICELERILGYEVRETNLFFLGIPDRVMCHAFPGGVELSDLSSRRLLPGHPAERLIDVGQWVEGWYFSVFWRGDAIIGRFISKDGLYTLACRSLEQFVRDPHSRYGKFTLASFIDTLIYGDPPD